MPTVNDCTDWTLTTLASNATATDCGIYDVAAFGAAFRRALCRLGYGDHDTGEICERDWLAAIDDAMRTQVES